MAALQGQVERLRRFGARLRHPAELFAAGSPPNHQLAASIRERLPAALLKSVECRDLVCQAEVGHFSAINDLMQHMRDDSWFTRWVETKAPLGNHVTLVLREPDEEFGPEILARVLKALYEGPQLAACADRHRDSGDLFVRLQIFSANDPENDREEPKILSVMHGASASSRFAACVGEELGRIINGTVLPAKVSSAVYEKAGLWPPAIQERYRRLVAKFSAGGD